MCYIISQWDTIHLFYPVFSGNVVVNERKPGWAGLP